MSEHVNITGTERRERLVNFMLHDDELDLNIAQVAAIVGNLEWESSRLQYKITNEIGAHGIAQWYKARRVALQKFASENGTNENSFTIQMQFLKHELLTYQNHTLKQIKQVVKTPNDIAKGTVIFEKLFEVSGDYKSYPNRIALSHQLYKDTNRGLKKRQIRWQRYGNLPSKTFQTALKSGNNRAKIPTLRAQINALSDKMSSSHISKIRIRPNTIAHFERKQPITDIKVLGNFPTYEHGRINIRKLAIVHNTRSYGDESDFKSKFYIKGSEGRVILEVDAAKAMSQMHKAAIKDGVDLQAVSSFRRNSHQQALAARNPNRNEVATPGFSKHQHGKAVDFALGMSYNATDFGTADGGAVSAVNPRVAPQSKQWKWLNENAIKFGFVQYHNEPWHFNFVG